LSNNLNDPHQKNCRGLGRKHRYEYEFARQEHQDISDDLLLSSTVVMNFRAGTYAGNLSRAHPCAPAEVRAPNGEEAIPICSGGRRGSEDGKGIAASPLRAASRSSNA